MATWWDKTKWTVQIGIEVTHEYSHWRTFHPKTEMCDQINLFDSEKELGRILDTRGLVFPNEMYAVLIQMESFLDDMKMYWDADQFRVCTEATELLVTAGLPLILFYCNLLPHDHSLKLGKT
jgi:hypothetical protein